ncbi:MAG: hypothetical protein IIU39_04060 [Ruminococcus sp.]|nr:hypothetical protein [Ruminococcus sp.]
MRNNRELQDSIIRGSCSLFACRVCRTKYGWAHQRWCELSDHTRPSCGDCRYFILRDGECTHPATNKLRKEECSV